MSSRCNEFAVRDFYLVASFFGRACRPPAQHVTPQVVGQEEEEWECEPDYDDREDEDWDDDEYWDDDFDDDDDFEDEDEDWDDEYEDEDDMLREVI